MIMSNENRELLKECISRVRSTSPKEWEIIVVDDASNPPYTKEEIGLSPTDTIVYMPKRSNCCNLRNVGMEMAKTDGVFWLDNDTMVSEGWWQPMVEKFKDDVGCVGQPKDSRLIRKPFFPLTQAQCMVEDQFSLDYNHLTGECDFITSYCILVRRKAYRPAYCFGMPTPMLDPDTGANIKINGYKIVVTDKDLPISHMGSQTPRVGGTNYHFYLSRNFTKWFKFWEPNAHIVFDLYKGIPVEYSHNANEPGRTGRRANTDARDLDFDEIPAEYQYES